jgi:hypothetical protein
LLLRATPLSAIQNQERFSGIDPEKQMRQKRDVDIRGLVTYHLLACERRQVSKEPSADKNGRKIKTAEPEPVRDGAGKHCRV